MEILIIIIILVAIWFVFKIVIPSIQITSDSLKDMGEASKYVDSNHPITKNAVAKARFKFVIKKYQKNGYSEKESIQLALNEFENNPEEFYK